MAGAMARGWASGPRGPEAMLFCDIDADRSAALAAQAGGETRGTLRELADDSDVVILVVKPAALEAVAEELEGKAPALLSLLGVTPIARIAEAFPGVPVLRVMPNQPVEVRQGVLCHAPAHEMPDDLRDELRSLRPDLRLVVAGDALAPRTLLDAVAEGARAGAEV